MPLEKLMILWSENQIVSLSIWLVVIITLLYLARFPAHTSLRALCAVGRNGLRLVSRAVMQAQHQLHLRNREVLFAGGRHTTERIIEREFEHVQTVVSRDLSAYPSLHRELKEQITNIDEDYRLSAEVPPSPPAWLKAIESVATIKTGGDPVVAKILEDIHGTLKKSHQQQMKEYRRSSNERHSLLRKMMPHWRSLSATLSSVENKIVGLEHRSSEIDGQVEQYRQILDRTDRAERILTTSALTQFFISALVLLVAVMGAYVNFQLIALPMSEMVGGGNYIGSIKASEVSALVIIAIEISMGLFLMEALGVTRMFPAIHSLDERMRHKMAWIAFAMLCCFAGIESALAYMRDLLAADSAALTQSLAGIVAEEPLFRWIPSVGQMVMGFVLPFALTFVAIPLESFVNSFRTVAGMVLESVLTGLAFAIRMAGNVVYSTGNFLINVYDLVIFIPLQAERFVSNRQVKQPVTSDNKVA